MVSNARREDRSIEMSARGIAWISGSDNSVAPIRKKTRAPLWGARQPKQPNLDLLCACLSGATW